MLKKIVFLVGFIGFLNATTIIDSPSDGHNIVVSNKSVNRIVLPYKIKDLIYSKEKGLMITINENQAFVKYVPLQQDIYADDPNNKRNTPVSSKIIYNQAKPAEVFFITSGKTYSFSLIPKNIKTQTIIINDYIRNKTDALKYETSNNYTTTMSKITKSVLLEQVPKGYVFTKTNKVVFKNHINDITLNGVYEGGLYKAFVFNVKNKTSVTRVIEPKDYFGYVKEKPLAISIYYDNEFNEFLPHSNAKVIVIVKAQQ